MRRHWSLLKHSAADRRRSAHNERPQAGSVGRCCQCVLSNLECRPERRSDNGGRTACQVHCCPNSPVTCMKGTFVSGILAEKREREREREIGFTMTSGHLGCRTMLGEWAAQRLSIGPVSIRKFCITIIRRSQLEAHESALERRLGQVVRANCTM